jgi:hypothetical protein
MSMSLRNELRSSSDNSTLVSENYNWADYFTNDVTASELINKLIPTFLILFLGLGCDVYITPVPTEASLGTITSSRRTALFIRIKLPWIFTAMATQLPPVVVWKAPFIQMDSVNSIRATPLLKK